MKDNRPTCPICGVGKVEWGKRKKDGSRGAHAKKCYQCKAKPYRIYKKDHCELCGFEPIHSCQLDIHHVDGNHKIITQKI